MIVVVARRRRFPCREVSKCVNANAASNFAVAGPTSVFTSRRSRNAALGASFSSVVLARVVVEGCTRKVAATARCGGDGIKTGPGETVPEASMFRRRLRAWVSARAELGLVRVSLDQTEGGPTNRASLRRKFPSAALVRMGFALQSDRPAPGCHSRRPWPWLWPVKLWW